MNISSVRGRQIGLAVCGLSVLVAGCRPLGEREADPKTGINGGFEVARNGLPVNWIMYTPNTVQDAEFRIVMDREVFREGRQSLRFDVTRCDGESGHNAPGFTNEFLAVDRFRGPASYRVSFWIRNSGADYVFSAGPVTLKTGDMKMLRRDHAEIREWTKYEYTIDIPDEHWLRMQLNVCSPGTLWIDDIQIGKDEALAQ